MLFLLYETSTFKMILPSFNLSRGISRDKLLSLIIASGNETQLNVISLLNEFEDEISENKRNIHVPMITKNIEIENSVKKAFEHIMQHLFILLSSMRPAEPIICGPRRHFPS